jgi:FkbM family methyltransferase
MNIISQDTRYGPLVYNANDPFFRDAIERYGEWSYCEVICWQAIIAPGSVVISAGANIGCHVVALAQLVGKEGAVNAFEPQRHMHRVAVANTVLCNVDHIARVHHAALGAVPGKISVPDIDYHSENSFGGLSLRYTPVPEEAPRYDVQLVTIDMLGLPRCDFIQLDIEGMEPEALEGARETIARCQPLLYLEVYDNAAPKLWDYMASVGYHAWRHLAPLFNPLNYRGNADNVWPDVVSTSWLCAPRDVDLSYLSLPKVTGPEGINAPMAETRVVTPPVQA